MPRVAAWLLIGIGAAHAQSFEVTSVRPSGVASGGERSGRPNVNVAADRVILRNHTLLDCVQWAYDVKEYQVTGPDWIRSEKYEITGKAAAAVPIAELRLMLRRLLEERFQLALHRESKDMPVLAIVPSRNGTKLREAAGDTEPGMRVLGPGLRVSFTDQPITDLAGFLSTLAAVDRPVLDRSGMTGRYSFTLDLNEAVKPAAEAAPSISTVLQEQLGLRLEGRRSAVDMLVIDRVERPSGN